MSIIKVTSSSVLLLRASSPSITPVICIVWFQTSCQALLPSRGWDGCGVWHHGVYSLIEAK